MDERHNVFQEHINRKVLIDWIKNFGLPNPQRKKFDVLLEEFAKEILITILARNNQVEEKEMIEMFRYPRDQPSPFSWPTNAGIYANNTAIRVSL